MKTIVAVLACFVLAVTPGRASEAAHAAGFAIVSVPDTHGAALTMGVWYPTSAVPAPRRLGLATMTVATDGPVEGTHLPLVILSHGQEGALGSHADTAVALAEAGFVAAAPVHTGDNFEDHSAVGGPKWFADRSRHISVAIDYLLTRWPEHDRIDGRHIGVFGFSAGGTTALIAIGGVPDFAAIAARCQVHPEFACTLWTGGSEAPLTHDRRIKAAVIAAPGFGFTFLPDGLKDVRVPVQMWNGDADTKVPPATNAVPIVDALGTLGRYYSVPGAGHFAFIVPCQGPPICTDAPGFDRAAFHQAFNAAAVTFFRDKLK